MYNKKCYWVGLPTRWIKDAMEKDIWKMNGEVKLTSDEERWRGLLMAALRSYKAP